jgi:hypothetical protein
MGSQEWGQACNSAIFRDGPGAGATEAFKRDVNSSGELHPGEQGKNTVVLSGSIPTTRTRDCCACTDKTANANTQISEKRIFTYFLSLIPAGTSLP